MMISTLVYIISQARTQHKLPHTLDACIILKTYIGHKGIERGKELSGENMIHIESFLTNQKASDNVSANQEASDR